MAVEYLGSGNDDGVVMGRDADDKIAFYNGTATAQQATTLAAAVTGGSTSTVVAAAFVELYDAIEALGLVRGTA